ncbi:Crp/Fnr family transcriptional regulator [Lachnospira pectinoschiza]|uniref:cAMP-binding domain of CRP or a regulatory subunit of cAMP-dependent protein kinases n=1 Tax=Lachnospira pectinoschiza TaxID=28052 RepID=A0A1G9YUA2_9FIRM|nr:Crp/Fnr family transcriptional regulator [Lachnospira pectinoschiza]SDN12003.1 cAMP-binding domain of CRP or a regulatory subunit of cAMP-dependent protein kinases [Lachnospira pectinoschiza]
MNIEEIMKTTLFMNMTKEEVEEVLKELTAYQKDYLKNEYIMCAGDSTKLVGIVLKGAVTIEANDVWGNKTILSHVGENGIFAETYALIPNETMLVDVCANTDSTILFIDMSGILTKSNMTSWMIKLIKNTLRISMHKNLILSKRSFHISKKGARERLLSYLNTMSLQKHSNEFDIPFNRQQLADYLNLERTNMSKELGRMQRDGLIEFKKNHFILKTVN